MEIRSIDDRIGVSGQITPADVVEIAAAGYRALVCNRPDGEGPDQPTFVEIAEAARAAGIEAHYQPVVSGRVGDEDAEAFGKLIDTLPHPVFVYCRTGTRSTTLWSLAQAARGRALPDILDAARGAGYDMAGVARRILNGGRTPLDTGDASHDIVVVGAGAGGIAVAASLLKRDASLDIAIIEPADIHYYQAGWPMVGAGVFRAKDTARAMAPLVPRGVTWIRGAVAAFEPANNAVVLDGCKVVKYRRLIVTPGLKLNWNAIDGLTETLGRNGVTSNYRYDLAPYTFDLVSNLTSGRAIFSAPPMPFKCTGAPLKTLFLSADHWRRAGRLGDINVSFNAAGSQLFGIPQFVPALSDYIERYRVNLNLMHNLVKIDGPAKRAWFVHTGIDGRKETVETTFDMIHVTPPQGAPDFIRVSPLADAAGWVDVEPDTLRHRTFQNIWALGDVTNTPNAKSAGAARQQAPVVANNVLADMGRSTGLARYDGYGSCPIAVERGKVVLAEFGYEGRLLPTFPKWLFNGERPSRAAWYLKEAILPPVYWKAMLRGREWLARPHIDA